MKVSFNEIENIVYKSFSGQGLPKSVYWTLGQVSRYLLTLQLIDLKTILTVLKSATKTTLDFGDDCVDFKNQSSTHYIDVLPALLIEKLLNKKNYQLQNINDAIFLVPAFIPLLKHSKKNLTILQTSNQQILAVLNQNDDYPSYLSPLKQSIEAITLVLTEQPATLPQQADKKYTQAHFAKQYQQQLNYGVAVLEKDWQQLQTYAKAVLVPDDATSKQDAGESEAVDFETLLIDKKQKSK